MAWTNDNLEWDLDAWVDRELLAALKLRAQIYRGRGPLKSVGEIVEEKIEAARNLRLGQQHPPHTCPAPHLLALRKLGIVNEASVVDLRHIFQNCDGSHQSLPVRSNWLFDAQS